MVASFFGELFKYTVELSIMRTIKNGVVAVHTNVATTPSSFKYQYRLYLILSLNLDRFLGFSYGCLFFLRQMIAGFAMAYRFRINS